MSYRILVKRLTITACFVCVVIAGYAFVKYVSTPSQSQIIASGSSPSSSYTNSFNNSPISVHNAYFSFVYPAAMFPYTQDQVKAPVLAEYSYGYRDIESWQLAVSAETLLGPSLSQDSSYAFRSQHPNQYQLTKTTVNGQQIAIMTDTQASGFSKVAFLLHGSDVVHISLYGNDNSGITMLDNVFMQVLNSFKWSTSG